MTTNSTGAEGTHVVSAEEFAALLQPGPDPEHARITLRWEPVPGWGDPADAARLVGLRIAVDGVVGVIESAAPTPDGQVEAVVVIPRPGVA